jgi:hypothetical protein
MTRERALMRFLYIRTLRRHVGPLLGWRVRTPANSNSAHLPSLRAGADCLSPVGPTTSQVKA